MTCYVPEESWAEVAAWVWKNWEFMNGVSFLPSADDGHVYQQAPYEDITKKEYNDLLKQMPKEIDWKAMSEEIDNTTASQEAACTGDKCEIL
jgi:hypothetical protein